MNLLTGIKIIDFTRLLPGPVATHLLAQMGAEVIKIESPQRVDYARSTGLKMVDGASHLFHQLNHNKTCKSIDYESVAGKEEVWALVKETDALIEQFRPGAMEAWGLGYEAMKAINPGLVYVSLTGYGQEGERKQSAGHDLNYLAQAGLLSLLKDAHGKPTVPGSQLADVGGAYMAVMAMQAALLKKAMTGQGSFVDVSMCGAMMPFLAVPFSLHSAGLDHEQFNILNGKTTVNYTVYQCADEKWLSVGALELKFWNRLCEVLAKPAWKRDHQLGLMNHVFPKAEVEALFRTLPRDQWIDQLADKDVCVAPVLELAELENDPYHHQRGAFETFSTDQGTELQTIGLPFDAR